MGHRQCCETLPHVTVRRPTVHVVWWCRCLGSRRDTAINNYDDVNLRHTVIIFPRSSPPLMGEVGGESGDGKSSPLTSPYIIDIYARRRRSQAFIRVAALSAESAMARPEIKKVLRECTRRQEKLDVVTHKAERRKKGCAFSRLEIGL